jgi:hypothetical protein
LPNCWRPIFLVLLKLYRCQVGLPNCWSCSYYSFLHKFGMYRVTMRDKIKDNYIVCCSFVSSYMSTYET